MSKRNRPKGNIDLVMDPILEKPRGKRNPKQLKAKNAKQERYIKAINVSDITISYGPAGTGKTYIAARKAAEALDRGEIEKIIITRPAVEAEEEFGFLPGDLDEKFAPYFSPVRKILEEHLGVGAVEYMVKAGKIEVAPIAFLRGHTFKDCWVLFDEAQNSTPKQMYLFLTRIGENCKVIIDGDLKQTDIEGQSGLSDVIDKMGTHPRVQVVRFQPEDIVRSGLARDIIMRYEGLIDDTVDEFNGVFRTISAEAA